MMLWLAAAAAVAAAPWPEPARASAPVVAQATASVQIVSGVRLKLDSPTNSGAPPAHDAKITADGKVQQARLIEFE